jgi:hypothetical protein
MARPIAKVTGRERRKQKRLLDGIFGAKFGKWMMGE